MAILAALLEGIGLTFIEPIVEVVQSEQTAEEADGLLAAFQTLYQSLGIPFTLGYLVGGVTLVMTIRYTVSFLVGWFRAAIETRYVRHLQEQGFMNALDARIEYFDEEGSDDILNAIVTQSEYAGKVIKYAINTMQHGLLAAMYFAIAFYIAPVLTILTALFLGLMTFLFRNVLDAGYSLGDRVADAKEGGCPVERAAGDAGDQGRQAVRDGRRGPVGVRGRSGAVRAVADQVLAQRGGDKELLRTHGGCLGVRPHLPRAYVLLAHDG